MNDLYRLQDSFQHYLLTEQIDIEAAIVQTKQVSVTTRLSIYKDAYQARLVESLANNYPVINTYLGDEEFQKMSFAYIDKYPSCYRSIRWFGDKLPDFLTTYYDDNYAYLAEIAQFEWNLTLSFDAADASVFQVEQMASIPPEAWANMQLIVHPSLQQMNFFWNTVPIWQAIIKDELPPSAIKDLQATSWILWRKEYINQFYCLSENESWAMDATLKGLTFGELCEGLCEWFDEQEVGMRAATLLKSWIQSGLLSNIKWEMP